MRFYDMQNLTVYLDFEFWVPFSNWYKAAPCGASGWLLI